MSEVPPPDAAPPASRTWMVVVSAALCLGILAAVVMAALAKDPPPRDPGAVDHRRPDSIPSRGPRRGPMPGMDADCGNVDPAKAPDLVFAHEDTKHLDFGIVPQGKRFQRDLVIRNAGKGVLCIQRVETGCGCMKAGLLDPGRRKIPVGETAVIRVHLDTDGQVGRIEKAIRITSNDLQDPIQSYPASCDVSHGLVVTPQAIKFDAVSQGHATEGRLFLRAPPGDGEWTVTGVRGTAPVPGQGIVAYTFQVDPVEDATHRRLRLTVRHPGVASPVTHRDPLVIETTHPERPRLIVQSHLNVTPHLRAVPPRVFLGYVRQGKRSAATRVRVVPGRPGVTVAIQRAHLALPDGRTGTPGGYDVTVGETDGVPWVDVRYDGSTRDPGLLEAVVVVETGDPVVPTLRIPVSATVR